MSHTLRNTAAAVFLLAGLATASAGPATPAPGTLTVAGSGPAAVEQIQYRHRGHRGDRGWGIGAGILGGAVIGSLLAPNYYGRSYYDDGYYAAPRVYVAPDVDDDAVGYCSRRFRSYDPSSGTYLGYDGFRHPCP